METRKLYPFSSSQQLVFLSWQFTLHKQITNIPTSFLVNAPLDLDLLKKAAEEAVLRNDSFGIRLTRQGKEKLQYFTDRKVLTMEILDFSGQTNETMEACFYKIGRKKMPMYDQPLAKIYIIKAPDGSCGIFSCICHLIMDSWAISMFCKDIMMIYLAYRDQAPLPKPLRSCEALLQKETEYRISDRHKLDLAFWRQELKGDGSLPIYTHINGPDMLAKYRRLIRKPDYRFGRTFFLRTTARHEDLPIARQDVEAMKKFCYQNNIPTMQLLFVMGLRTYLARVNGREKNISFYSIVARRGTLDEKMSGGTRAQTMPLRTIMPEDIHFKEALDLLAEKQNSLYRHADFDTMEIFNLAYELFGMKRGEDYCTLPFTFQPVSMDFGNGMRISTKWYCTGAAAASIYITVMDGDGTGSLKCYYEYMNHIIKTETILSCHHYTMKVIKAGIADPSITLKDLLDLPLSD